MIQETQNIVPKRLSFDFLNNSLGSGELCSQPFVHFKETKLIILESASKKRKFNDSEFLEAHNVSSTKNGSKADESLNSSSGSITASWETKLLRSDLMEAQSRVSFVQSTLNFCHPCNRFLDFSIKERNPASKHDPVRVGVKIFSQGKGSRE